ncbi:MAG: hypothetical protein ACPG21_00585 [Crocinitomicaceae bacterium]
MKRFLAITGILGLFTFTNSCETEFSLNGDYEIIPVVFGLIDHTDSIHMVKITKAFLGDGDNLLYAQNPDSSYFQSVVARIYEYDQFGDETGRIWNLTDSIVDTKSTDGAFYAPEQKVYYFKANDLNPKYEYEIKVDINEGQAEVSAKTTLIDGFAIPNSFTADPDFPITFAAFTVDEDDDYKNWKVDISEGKNAKLYEFNYDIHWTEYYEDGTTSSFTASRYVGSYGQEDPDSPLAFFALVSGLDFYTWLGESLPDDPNVVRRTFDGLDAHIDCAHEDLAKFMEVSEPVSGIAQIQPEFTNIIGGYGLFSSRQRISIIGKSLNSGSFKELARGSKTVTKLFCSPLPEHSEEEWYCD